MSFTVPFKGLKLILAIATLLLNLQYVFVQDLNNGGKTEDWILKLYEKYKEAVLEETTGSKSVRRFSDRSKQYQIHVEKLKEVNGYKRHNLFIKQSQRNGDSEMIYIINPIEARFPHPYLSLEEFKEALMKRSEKIRSTNVISKNFGSQATKKLQKMKKTKNKINKTLNNTSITKEKRKLSVATEATKHDIKTSSLKPTRTSSTITVALTEKNQVNISKNNDKVTKTLDVSPPNFVTSTQKVEHITETTVKVDITTKLQEERTNPFVDTTKSFVADVESSTTLAPTDITLATYVDVTRSTNLINNHTDIEKVTEVPKKPLKTSVQGNVTDSVNTTVSTDTKINISKNNGKVTKTLDVSPPNFVTSTQKVEHITETTVKVDIITKLQEERTNPSVDTTKSFVADVESSTKLAPTDITLATYVDVTRSTNLINNHTDIEKVTEVPKKPEKTSVQGNVTNSVNTTVSTDTKITAAERATETTVSDTPNLENTLPAKLTTTYYHADTAKVTELSLTLTFENPVVEYTENVTKPNNTVVIDTTITDVESTKAITVKKNIVSETETIKDVITALSVSPEVKPTSAHSKYRHRRPSKRTTVATTLRKKLTRRTLGRPLVYMNGG